MATSRKKVDGAGEIEIAIKDLVRGNGKKNIPSEVNRPGFELVANQSCQGTSKNLKQGRVRRKNTGKPVCAVGERMVGDATGKRSNAAR